MRLGGIRDSVLTVLSLLTVLSSPAPIPSPQPEPLSASLAQGLIAALTFVHAGVIGYAISHESKSQAELIGERYNLSIVLVLHITVFQSLGSRATINISTQPVLITKSY